MTRRIPYFRSLSLSFLALSALVAGTGCKPRPKAGPAASTSQQAVQKRQQDWTRYWQETIGVKDPGLLARISQAENQHGARYRLAQQELDRLRNQLKIGTTENTLSPPQSDSLLTEISRRTDAVEREGIQYWHNIDTMLTPDQRRARIARLNVTSPELMQDRLNPLNLPGDNPR